MPRPLLAANWKMHPVPPGALDADSPFRPRDEMDVVVFPAHPDIPACVQAGLTVGGQYGRVEDSGAFTGDVSLAMLKNHGCQYVLCGHSERRHGHGETDDEVAAQAHRALELGLQPIICVGETISERNNGRAEAVVGKQVDAVFSEKFKVNSEKCPIIIAYEPVWAIGTGETATPEQVQEMHAFIKRRVKSEERTVQVLYGGSIKPANAAELLARPDVDGGLVGGASLHVDTWRELVEIMKSEK